MVINFQLQN